MMSVFDTKELPLHGKVWVKIHAQQTNGWT